MIADADREGIATMIAYPSLGIGASSFADTAFAEDFARRWNRWAARFADARTVFAAVERSVREGLSEGVREAPVATAKAPVGADVAARAEAATTAFLSRGVGPVARPLWSPAAPGAERIRLPPGSPCSRRPPPRRERLPR